MGTANCRPASVFGHHLCLGGHHALAHFDLAGEHGDAAVSTHREVGVEVFRIETLARLGPGCQRRNPDQHHDSAATQFDEAAAADGRPFPDSTRVC
jgi:hypothetical protein